MESKTLIQILNRLGYVVGITSIILFILSIITGGGFTISLITLVGGLISSIIIFAIGDALDSLRSIVNNLALIHRSIEQDKGIEENKNN